MSWPAILTDPTFFPVLPSSLRDCQGATPRWRRENQALRRTPYVGVGVADDALDVAEPAVRNRERRIRLNAVTLVLSELQDVSLQDAHPRRRSAATEFHRRRSFVAPERMRTRRLALEDRTRMMCADPEEGEEGCDRMTDGGRPFDRSRCRGARAVDLPDRSPGSGGVPQHGRITTVTHACHGGVTHRTR
jgi:hypothetical protein